jgi:hypothetical protein
VAQHGQPARLHPRRTAAGPLDHGAVGTGLRHERLAVAGAAGLCLPRRPGVALAGGRAAGRHLAELATDRGQAAHCHRGLQRRADPARVPAAALRRSARLAQAARRGGGAAVFHLLHGLGAGRRGQAVRSGVRPALHLGGRGRRRRGARLHLHRRLPGGQLDRRAAGHVDAGGAGAGRAVRPGRGRRAGRTGRRPGSPQPGIARRAERFGRRAADVDCRALAAGLGARLLRPAARAGAIHGRALGLGTGRLAAHRHDLGEPRAGRGDAGRAGGRCLAGSAAAGRGLREGVHGDGSRLAAPGDRRDLPGRHPRRDHEHCGLAAAGRVIGRLRGPLPRPAATRCGPGGTVVDRSSRGDRDRHRRVPAGARPGQQGARPGRLCLGRIRRVFRPDRARLACTGGG